MHTKPFQSLVYHMNPNNKNCQNLGYCPSQIKQKMKRILFAKVQNPIYSCNICSIHLFIYILIKFTEVNKQNFKSCSSLLHCSCWKKKKKNERLIIQAPFSEMDLDLLNLGDEGSLGTLLSLITRTLHNLCSLLVILLKMDAITILNNQR